MKWDGKKRTWYTTSLLHRGRPPLASEQRPVGSLRVLLCRIGTHRAHLSHLRVIPDMLGAQPQHEWSLAPGGGQRLRQVFSRLVGALAVKGETQI